MTDCGGSRNLATTDRNAQKENAAPRIRDAAFSRNLYQGLATLAATATLRDETLALSPLAGQLARTANGFSLLASLLLRRLFIMIAALHLAESTFPLHLLFQRAERLLHIIVAHNDLYDGSLSIIWTQGPSSRR
jgi:hypothetical protein